MDWMGVAGLLLGGGSLGALANVVAGRFKRDEARMSTDVLRLQHQQSAEDKFRDDLILRVDRLQAGLDAQNEKLIAQAVEIAELRGKIQVLEHSESFLKLENQRLRTENEALRVRNTELNDENELQAERLIELRSRLSVYEALPTTPGDCP